MVKPSPIGMLKGISDRQPPKPPPPLLVFDSPVIRAAPAAPVYQAPRYNPPVSNYIPSAPSQQPWTGGYSPGTPAPAAPPPPPKPNYEGMGNGELKGHDATFADQDAMYTDKLKKYIADYDRQVGSGIWGKQVKAEDLGGTLGNDFKTASQGIERNRTQGLTSLSEDFANRGLGSSGLFVKNHQDASNNYDRQKTGLGSSIINQVNDLGFRRNNFEADIQASLASARRDALSRLASSQSLA
ncbi:hypothetical protein GURGLEFERB_24 [Arthrobacter phage GurgleFerb]|uniref:Uncharacterized protein n=1 Tax=Arthrobacter phage GurgleFerb TaxID=2027884 RepID=A0A249XN68_9CAUD|nr:hypothetical protein GURGLEFERB_24 [Arthrobacter phage GurgleFerb]